MRHTRTAAAHRDGSHTIHQALNMETDSPLGMAPIPLGSASGPMTMGREESRSSSGQMPMASFKHGGRENVPFQKREQSETEDEEDEEEIEGTPPAKRACISILWVCAYL